MPLFLLKNNSTRRSIIVQNFEFFTNKLVTNNWKGVLCKLSQSHQIKIKVFVADSCGTCDNIHTLVPLVPGLQNSNLS